jgi:hypothetical protein
VSCAGTQRGRPDLGVTIPARGQVDCSQLIRSRFDFLPVDTELESVEKLRVDCDVAASFVIAS